MTQEQLKAILEKAKSDHRLQEMLDAATDSDAVVAIANAAGIVITADKPKKAQAEVSGEELERVRGGRVRVAPPPSYVYFFGNCY